MMPASLGAGNSKGLPQGTPGRGQQSGRRSVPVEKGRAERWEHFSHEADIGVRGFGTSQADAFAQTATALTAVITDPALVEPDTQVTVTCNAPDAELLLVDWLNAIIFEMATRRMLFGRFEVEIQDGELSGRMWGERVDVARHEPAVEIKGATYTEVRVSETKEEGWIAQCVVDT